MPPVAEPFPRRLQDPRPLLLDGGLATWLESQGVPLHETLWSAGLLHTAPDHVRAAHAAYRAAGAEVLISASYQASREGLRALDLDAGAADRLIAGSVTLARQGGEDADRPAALVAASVGPWGATRHDGSEYSGAISIDDAALAAFHAERLAVLDRAGADVLACETLPNHREVMVLAGLLEEVRTPAWVSFCCRDERTLSDGTPVTEVAARFRDHPRVVALGINCTAPRHVTGLIRRLRDAAPDLPVLVYPNSGEQYDAERQRWSGLVDPADLAEEAKRWLDAGARGIGGCCRMGPAHIRAMARVIEEEYAP